jgi:hypothetical protein
MGFVEKAEFLKDHPEAIGNQTAIDIVTHALAFARCTIILERTMRQVWPGEIAQLVAEDHALARQYIKQVHSLFRNPSQLGDDYPHRDFLPLSRIRGSVQFAEKDESRPLQLADTCAFFIRGHLEKHPRAEEFYKLIAPHLLVLPKGEEPTPLQLMFHYPYGPMLVPTRGV